MVRFEPKTLGIEGVVHNHYDPVYTVRMTNWPFYLNCVRTGVSLVTSFTLSSVYFATKIAAAKGLVETK